MDKKFFWALLLASTIISVQLHGQNTGMSIGKGGEAPHKNAVFEAVSSDKGVLIPRLSSFQRNIIAPGADASGLLVYDTDIAGFMFYNGTQWLPITPDPIWQNLSVDGDKLSITLGNSVVLPKPTLSYNPLTYSLLYNGTSISLANLASGSSGDADPTNELQTLSIAGRVISISDGNSIELPSGIVSSDQALSFVSATNILTLENGGSVNLSQYAADLDPTNELQKLSIADDSLVLSLGGGKVKLLQNESDPIWTVAKDNYYTKTQLQTSGDATISWGNISDIPSGIDMDTSDDFSGDYADLTNAPTATLTDNAIPRWDATSASFADGSITDDGTNVAVGGAVNPSYLLFVNGKLGSSGISELSDARFKTDVAPLIAPLETVCRLRAVTYVWDSRNFPERNFSSDKEIGFIAQEVESVFPELVTTGADGYKTVQYSRTVAVLLEAIKELNATVENQKASISRLEAGLQAAESYNARLDNLQQQINMLLPLLPSATGTAQK